MPPPPFVHELLGWRRGAPNVADSSSKTSMAIATALLEILGIRHEVDWAGQTAGSELEERVRGFLEERLPSTIGGRKLTISRNPLITAFAQYEHLASVKELIEADETQTLKATLGADYVIKPDVTAGISQPDQPPLLHAAIPCKWTLRSDRAQNVRHEAVILIRHRRGRLPHITPVTAEPLPTRLASLARGTAEVDATYHVALEALEEACEVEGTDEQSEVLDELIKHDRLRDLGELIPTLSL